MRTGFIGVEQDKTKEKVRIAIQRKLATLIDKIIARKRFIDDKVVSTRLPVQWHDFARRFPILIYVVFQVIGDASLQGHIVGLHAKRGKLRSKKKRPTERWVF